MPPYRSLVAECLVPIRSVCGLPAAGSEAPNLRKPAIRVGHQVLPRHSAISAGLGCGTRPSPYENTDDRVRIDADNWAAS